MNAVAVDADRRLALVADRCGANPDVPPGESAFQYDTCAGSSWAPVHKVDPEGNLVTSFGAGLFVFPHKIAQDPTATLGRGHALDEPARESEIPEREPRG